MRLVKEIGSKLGGRAGGKQRVRGSGMYDKGV